MSNTYNKQENFLRTLRAIKRGANTCNDLKEVVGSCGAFAKLRKMGLIEIKDRLYLLTELGHKFLLEGEKQ